MESVCYILYSAKLSRFYVGSTRLSAEERLSQHLVVFYGNKKSFTAKTKDWMIYHEIHCDHYKQALLIEEHIKRMRSKTYIEKLKIYPEIEEGLKLRYSNGFLPR